MTSIEHDSYETDPFDWTTEDVVKNICSPQGSLRKVYPSLTFPESATLASKIREVGVGGLAFLQEVDDSFIEQKLGVTSLNEKATLKRVIKYLRLRSARWQSEEAMEVSSTAARSIHHSVPPSISRYSTFHNPGPPPGLRPWESPLGIQNGIQLPLNSDPSFRRYQSPALMRSSMDLGGMPPPPPILSPACQRLDAQLRATPLNSWYGLETLNRTLSTNQSDASEIAKVAEQDPDCKAEETNQKTRSTEKKRIVPINVRPLETSNTHVIQTAGSEALIIAEQSLLEDDKDLRYSLPACPEQITSETQDVVDSDAPHNRKRATSLLNGFVDVAMHETTTTGIRSDTKGKSTSPSIDQGRSTEMIESNSPGVVHIGKEGRKRVMPMTIDDWGEEVPLPSLDAPLNASATQDDHLGFQCGSFSYNANKAAFGRVSRRRPDLVYLGLQSLPIDELFYGPTKLGETISDNEEHAVKDFQFFGPPTRSSGQSLYTNKCVKYFLRSEPFSVTSNGKTAICRIPYQESLILPHCPISLTVMSKNQKGEYISQRQNRADYLRKQESRAFGDNIEEDVLNHFKVKDPAMAVDEIDKDEWKTLEKWKYIDGMTKCCRCTENQALKTNMTWRHGKKSKINKDMLSDPWADAEKFPSQMT